MQKNNLDETTNLLLNNEYSLNDNDEVDEEIEYKNIKKKKKTKKKKILLILKILFFLILLFVIFIFLFFKTSLFQKYKELWVETAMSTMNHQFLATWFLSEDENHVARMKIQTLIILQYQMKKKKIKKKYH